MDGVAGHTVWSDLLTAVAKGKDNPNGYTYALASQDFPENADHLAQRQAWCSKTAANTGISDASTVDGTFPVT